LFGKNKKKWQGGGSYEKPELLLPLSQTEVLLRCSCGAGTRAERRLLDM